MLKKDQAAGPGLFKNLALFLLGRVNLGRHRRLLGLVCSGWRTSGGGRVTRRRKRAWCGGAVSFNELRVGTNFKVTESDWSESRFEQGLPQANFSRHALIDLIGEADDGFDL